MTSDPSPNGSKTKNPPLAQQEKVEHTRNQAKQLYLVLLIIGLVLGAFLSVGIVIALQQFGLTDNQPQIEQQ